MSSSRRNKAGHRFECKWGPSTVFSREELQQHEVSAHNAHYCHECDELCYSPQDLKLHEAAHNRSHECY